LELPDLAEVVLFALPFAEHSNTWQIVLSAVGNCTWVMLQKHSPVNIKTLRNASKHFNAPSRLYSWKLQLGANVLERTFEWLDSKILLDALNTQ
jgi:hypothetical protein